MIFLSLPQKYNSIGILYTILSYPLFGGGLTILLSAIAGAGPPFYLAFVFFFIFYIFYRQLAALNNYDRISLKEEYREFSP